jgi:hypothetical protein
MQELHPHDLEVLASSLDAQPREQGRSRRAREASLWVGKGGRKQVGAPLSDDVRGDLIGTRRGELARRAPPGEARFRNCTGNDSRGQGGEEPDPVHRCRYGAADHLVTER